MKLKTRNRISWHMGTWAHGYRVPGHLGTLSPEPARLNIYLKLVNNYAVRQARNTEPAHLQTNLPNTDEFAVRQAQNSLHGTGHWALGTWVLGTWVLGTWELGTWALGTRNLPA